MSPVTDKLTILFLAANPADTNQLELDEELRSIDQELRKSELRDQFDLRAHWAVRFSDLQELLLRYSPHVVHFSGHGSQVGEIILKNDDGLSQPVAPDVLADLFDILKDNVRCVVLNACYSDMQARGIARSIECVVGMSRAIGDPAAIQFASGFYLGLGYGRSIRDAVGLGRTRISGAGMTDETTPKLTVRKGIDPAQIVLVSKARKESKDTDGSGSNIANSRVDASPKLVKLNGTQFEEFFNALLSAFDYEELSLMLRIHLDANLSAVAKTGRLEVTVFSLIEWAQRTGNLDRLLDGALACNPSNQQLRSFARAVGKA